MKKGLLLLCLMHLILFLACKKEAEEPLAPAMNAQNQIDLLDELYTKEIAPTNLQLLNQYKFLQAAFEVYKADTNLINKQKLENQWKVTAITYTKAKVFNITPIKRVFYFSNMYTFPLSQSMILELETNYKNKSIVNVTTFANNKKGLALVEHLIFKQDSLYLYSGLFTATLNDLILNQNLLIELWETKVKQPFVSGQTIALNNGFGELINAFISIIEVSKKEEFDLPFGYYSEQKNELKANKSMFSKELYHAQFDYLNYLMNSYFYPFFLKEQQTDLIAELKNGFQRYLLSIKNIENKNFEFLQPSVPNMELNAIQNSVKEILKVLKLKVILNYNLLLAISDADGD